MDLTLIDTSHGPRPKSAAHQGVPTCTITWATSFLKPLFGLQVRVLRVQYGLKIRPQYQ